MKGETQFEKEGEVDVLAEKQSPAERGFPVGFYDKEL
jgi:hypothetical protein